MLSLLCPCCGVEADESELSPGGPAHVMRAGPDADDTAFESYLFLRDNPKGPHLERWRHSMGCGKWFHAARSTTTLEVFGTYPAQTGAPPDDIRRRIITRYTDWSWDENV